MIPTPDKPEDFNSEWVKFVLEDYFTRNEKDPQKINILKVDAKINEVQGILSTTFVVDVDYQHDDEEPETKSIFVKVPLKDDPTFASVNVRELVMFTDVLPKLQVYLDENCDGFFRLPMPERLYCYYDGKGIHDVFVFENLLADGFENFNTTCLDQQHLKSVLECLSQLHGTGFAYKKTMGGKQKLLEEFPKLEVQLQLQDLIETPDMRNHLRKHIRPFLHFLSDEEPMLAGHAGYMRKMHKHINKIIEVLENSGYENLITFAHGDAKPNNFMFRNIEIDLEDLECEGLQAILIDWQGGFLGSVANDLMWALFPFLEANQDDKLMCFTAIEYYHDMLKNVLEGFHLTLSDLNLPEDLPSFFALLRKSLVLEFLIVTVIKPIICLESENAEKLVKWHKETVRNETRRFRKKVERPSVMEIFSSPRFPSFCHLYFRIATALGAFQEMGKIYFEVMKDDMFEDVYKKMDTHDSDVDDPDPDLFYRIINTPIPKMPKIPKLPKWREITRKTWLTAASVTGGVLVAGLGLYIHQVDPDLVDTKAFFQALPDLPSFKSLTT